MYVYSSTELLFFHLLWCFPRTDGLRAAARAPPTARARSPKIFNVVTHAQTNRNPEDRAFPTAVVWEFGEKNRDTPPNLKLRLKTGYLWYVLVYVSITWISKITFLSALYIATFLDIHKLTQCELIIHDTDIYIYIYIYISKFAPNLDAPSPR